MKPHLATHFTSVSAHFGRIRRDRSFAEATASFGFALLALACSTGDGTRVTSPSHTAAGTTHLTNRIAASDCSEPIDVSSLPTLAAAFAPHFRVGAALSPDTFQNSDTAAASLVEQQFNQISPENVLKWSEVNPRPGVYRFDVTDAFVEFGEQRGMQVHGHVLVWHQQTPDWVFRDDNGGQISAEALWKRLESHITQVAGRYGGRIKYWDVVNEAFEDDGSLRDTPWRQILGDDYLAEVFALADRLLPDSKLVYNDYSLFLPNKRDAVVALVNDLKTRNIRIDAVGMQGHYKLDRPRPEEVGAAITAYAGAKVEVLISELDLDVLPSERSVQGADLDDTETYDARLNPYGQCLPKNAEEAIAARWAQLFATFTNHADAISSVTFWGVSDGYSWLNDWPVRGRTNYPLLFDRNHQPKSAFKSVLMQVE